jgi:hypothetical protein
LATKLFVVIFAFATAGVFPPALFCEPVTCEVSSYLGGAGDDQANAVAVDSLGRVYLAGNTYSSNFPAYSATLSPYQSTRNGDCDVFVAQFASGGSFLYYSTYLGGGGYDSASDIAVDLTGDAYIAGYTLSNNFPVLNAYQSSRGGLEDAFLAKLDVTGSCLEYSTYLGGIGEDIASGVAVSPWTVAVVSGYTYSVDFPTVDAYQSSNNGYSDAFLTMFSLSGSSLYGSTYFGGFLEDYGSGVAIHPSLGHTYLCGTTISPNFPLLGPYQNSLLGNATDCFVAKFDMPSSALFYSTYLGGTEDDFATGIALDSAAGCAVVTGGTASSSFPVTWSPRPPSPQDGFVTRLNSTGSALSLSTFWGGGGEDTSEDIAVDSAGNIFIAGVTDSPDFPIENAYQATSNGANPPPTVNPQYVEGFAAGISPSGPTVLFSTYLGGTKWDMARGVAVGSGMGVWVVGETGSDNFPSVNSYQRSRAGGADAFLSRLRYDPSPRQTRVDSGDYDGDLRADPAYFDPRNGGWRVRGVINTVLGVAGDIPVSGDYDGDGTTEIALFRPSNAQWIIRGIGRPVFGIPGDIPVPGDYDGDGTTDLAIFRPRSEALWAVQGIPRVNFGREGDIPIPGDYNHDGVDEFAIYRPHDQYWAVRGGDRFNFGPTTIYPDSLPVPGDYCGDARLEAAIYVRSGYFAGSWFIRDFTQFEFGCPQEWPMPADYDGDEKDEPALFNAPAGLWRVPDVTRFIFGSTGVIPATR